MKALIIIVALFLAAVLWLARFEIYPVHGEGEWGQHAYKLDRWTGEVALFSGGKMRDTKELRK